MVKKEKIKHELSSKSKIIVLGLVVVFILIGILTPTLKARADTFGTCQIAAATSLPEITFENVTREWCNNWAKENNRTVLNWVATAGKTVMVYCSIPLPEGQQGPVQPVQMTAEECAAQGGSITSNTGAGGGAGVTDEQEKGRDPYECGWTNLTGCALWFMDTIFISTFGLFFWVLGQFFNILVSLALSGALYKSTFVIQAWGIVRNVSNIFFIIILLYIAIKIILDLGGAEAKKMIGKVIIAALLINFSMFFTWVVIDASNILGLIFYNKIGVTITGQGRNYDSIRGETDISGGLVGKFMPSKLINSKIIKQAGEMSVGGAMIQIAAGFVGPVVLVSLLSLSGSLIIIGIVVFVLIVLAFLNRIGMLMFLILFSPFAFMSFAFPELGKLEYIGWEDWKDRLLKNAFFAPIFMFILYFIFMLIDSGLLESALNLDASSTQTFIVSILGICFGFFIIMLLLWFAIKFAYKASGKAGEIFTKIAKTAAMAGLGVATGGAGMALTSTLGGMASRAAAGAPAGSLRAKLYGGLARTDFGAGLRTGISGVTGQLGLGAVGAPPAFLGMSTEGGIRGMREREYQESQREYEERQKEVQRTMTRSRRANELGEDSQEKQDLNAAERDLQDATGNIAEDLRILDEQLDEARKRKSDSGTGTQDHNDALYDIKAINKRKEALMRGEAIPLGGYGVLRDKSGQIIGTRYAGGARGATGVNIHNLQETVRGRKETIIRENRRRIWDEADRLEGLGGAENREAAHKLRMEHKIKGSED